MLKGITRVDDAKRAVDAGVDRHLGVQPRRQQPRQHPRHRSGRCPRIAEAVGDDIEVLLDGGVRRGSDVVKAVALGARAVMIGRAYLWGLAANGQAGVENVLDILRSGIDSALLGPRPLRPSTSCPRTTCVIPPGFALTLGGTSVAPPAAGRPDDDGPGTSGSRDRAWPHRFRQDAVVLVPLGSTEQHGPHLPLSTDTVDRRVRAGRAAEALARRRTPPPLVAPALAYGASGEHAGFPGTVSIGHEALHAVLVETVRSLSLWAGRVVFVNGHGGNTATLDAALGALRAEGHDVAWAGLRHPGRRRARRPDRDLGHAVSRP